MAYLIDHPPKISQYRERSRRLTGLTVLHSSESILDTVGPDTGAEAVAKFIAGRGTYGSYHDLVDSDSGINLVPYELAAFQDGTGSNEFALSLAFACSTSDWRKMTAAQRRGFLNQGARKFVEQQKWRAQHGYPLTELRYITKAQSDAGMSGFCCHGWRDPSRRTDPGINAPNLFPFDEWLEACRAALAGTPFEEDLMPALSDAEQRHLYEMVGGLTYMLVPEGGYDGPAGDVITKIGALQWGMSVLLSREPQNAEIDAEVIAKAIPAELAEQVAQKLADRLAS